MYARCRSVRTSQWTPSASWPRSQMLAPSSLLLSSPTLVMALAGPFSCSAPRGTHRQGAGGHEWAETCWRFLGVCCTQNTRQVAYRNSGVSENWGVPCCGPYYSYCGILLFWGLILGPSFCKPPNGSTPTHGVRPWHLAPSCVWAAASLSRPERDSLTSLTCIIQYHIAYSMLHYSILYYTVVISILYLMVYTFCHIV